MKFREIEKILLKDGWKLKNVKGSYYQYIHPTKNGKITIPRRTGNLDPRTVRSILEQAGFRNSVLSTI